MRLLTESPNSAATVYLVCAQRVFGLREREEGSSQGGVQCLALLEVCVAGIEDVEELLVGIIHCFTPDHANARR